MNNAFYPIWNQLVLCSQFEIYGDYNDIFDSLEKQTTGARERRMITNRQYIILINAIREWRDILGKPCGTEDNGPKAEGDLQIPDPAE